MSLLDFAGHLAFALIAISFVVRDIVWLRALSIVASIASISYSYFAPAQPLWIVIGWNVLFITVNLTQLVLLFRERRGVEFSEEEQEVYATRFSRLTPVEFARLMHIGRWEDLASECELIAEHAARPDVLLLYSGRAAVTKNGRHVTDLRAGDFAGEISFMSGAPAAGRVVTSEASRALRWPREELERLLDRNPSMRAAIRSELSEDMARKLARRSGTTGAFVPPAGLPPLRID